MCREPLEYNRNLRAGAVQRYLAGDNNALLYLLWSADYGQDQLNKAKELEIYDINRLKQTSP
jgi:hypothetical protein